MARTTKEEALRTRQKLIETAIDVFYERGVSSTTLEQVADAANLTRGALYWHFENKLDLISAVHDHFHLQILGTIQEQIEQANTPPLERIKNSWRNFLHNIVTNAMYRKAMTVFMLKCDYSGDMAALLQQQLNRKAEARKMLAVCFQEAIDKGEVAPGYTRRAVGANTYVLHARHFV